MAKELGERAIRNRLNKYFEEHYANVEGVELKETNEKNKIKLFTPTHIVFLVSDEFGKITEQQKKRPQRKSKNIKDVEETVASEDNKEIKDNKDVSISTNNIEDIKETKKKKVSEKKEIKHKVPFKQGEIVKNIYNNVPYQVLESIDNIVKVYEPNAKLYLCMAVSDVELVQ